MIDPGFQLGVAVFRIIGKDLRILIGQNIYLLLFRQLDNAAVGLHWKFLLENDFPCAAVRDHASIERQDITAIVLQFQFLRQRHYAVGWPAGSQNYLDSPLLRFHQTLFCSRSDYLVPVG